MAPAHLVDRILKALRAEEEATALEVGRGKVDKEKRDDRIGQAKGLARAIVIVNNEARNVEKEDDDGK